jgi:adenylosuccinate synthase
MSKRNQFYLCAGAIIHPETLLKETEKFDIDPDRIAIHPRCAIITDSDIINEKSDDSSVTKIASTQSGVGSALVNKINRSAKLAKDIPELKDMICELDLHYLLDQGCTALMEVPQGFDLSISSGFQYPYCTSREITVPAALTDAQVHPSYLGKVAVCLRTYPIRVGNIIKDGKELGYSGDFYPDSIETNWNDIGVEAELTTVTKRIRRVATFSKIQYKKMLDKLRPDYILLNFSNYMSKKELCELLEDLPEVTHLGFGPEIKDVFLNNVF